MSGITGDGGGGGGPSSTTTNTSNIPEYARPYVEQMLGSAQKEIFNYEKDPKTGQLVNKGVKEYTPFSANMNDYFAGFSPMQEQAMRGAANMGTSPQLDTASGLAGLAGSRAMGAEYTAGQFDGGKFGNQQAQQYMNPYMQNVVDIQQREAQRQADIAGTQRGAQAVQAGAFGGSRQAIMDAEAARNLATQKGDIQAQGSNAAFTNAQQQFNQDMSRGLQAQQMGEQSRQYGAGMGMQGLQTALQSANTLGQLGQTQYGQQMGNIQMQNQMGGQQQQMEQAKINQQIQNYAMQQQYPQQQLAYMNALLRGLPMQSTTTQSYQAAPSAFSQLAGLGATAAGAYGAYGGFGKAKGGAVKARKKKAPVGLAELAIDKMR